MQFQFGPYLLDVYVEKNQAAYEKLDFISNTCGCCNCQNYVKASQLLPKEVSAFFQALGIDIRKSPEVYAIYMREDGLVNYAGFYHLCGRILADETTNEVKGTAMQRDENVEYPFPVSDNFRVAFTPHCNILEDGFPKPAIQMEISAYIPWVLEK